jgi:hypothetical protein
VRGVRVEERACEPPSNSSRLFPGQTLLVRITRIDGLAFRGKVADTAVGPAPLRVGAVLAFTADHIHSIAK